MRFICLTVAALWAAFAAPTLAMQTRCGWLQVYSFGDVWDRGYSIFGLYDKDRNWYMNGYQSGMPDFSSSEFHRNQQIRKFDHLGLYPGGWGAIQCVCLDIDHPKEGENSLGPISNIRSQPLQTCRNDGRLEKHNRYLFGE